MVAAGLPQCPERGYSGDACSAQLLSKLKTVLSVHDFGLNNFKQHGHRQTKY